MTEAEQKDALRDLARHIAHALDRTVGNVAGVEAVIVLRWHGHVVVGASAIDPIDVLADAVAHEDKWRDI